MTLKELKKYKFNNNFSDLSEKEDDISITTLREFFEWFEGENIFVNIELKTNIFAYEGIEEKTLHLIDEFKIRDKVIISLFNHYSVMKFKELARDVKCGFLTPIRMYEPGKYCKNCGVEYYHPNYISLKEEDIINLKQNSIGINCYTVDEPDIMLSHKRSGVDSIITNKVELAVKTLYEK